jgi:hypothetical protein
VGDEARSLAQVACIGGGQWRMQPEALSEGASELHQQLELMFVLDVLGNSRDSQRLAQADHRREQPFPVGIVLSSGHKAAIELDLVEVQLLQIAD